MKNLIEIYEKRIVFLQNMLREIEWCSDNYMESYRIKTKLGLYRSIVREMKLEIEQEDLFQQMDSIGYKLMYFDGNFGHIKKKED